MNPLAADLDHILAHTEELWQGLRGCRLFITGGTGFFGCWLLEALVDANERLRLNARATVLTRDAAAFSAKAPHLANGRGVALLEGEVTTFVFPSGEFSHVIHAAVDYREPLGLFVSTVEGTRRTLEFARAAKAKRYLLTSSGAVYGRQPPEITHIPETYAGAPDPLQTRSAYGEAKRASELLCGVYHESDAIEATIARGFAFVGPYLALDSGSAIGNFVRDAMAGGPIRIGGDGTPFRSYLYGADLAIWLWRILCHGAPVRPYNVGCDREITISETAKVVAEVVNPAATVEIAKAAPAGIAAERYVPSIDRARQELGLESWIDVHEGVRRTAQWQIQRRK